MNTIKKKAHELIFISQINRDGSGTSKVSESYLKSMLENRLMKDSDFDIRVLSLSEKTFIASNFNSFVVRLKEDIKITKLRYITDGSRHLICLPYSIENLHKMAEELNIKRCWFHTDHYDIPKKRIDKITEQCEHFSSKQIVTIINEKHQI